MTLMMSKGQFEKLTFSTFPRNGDQCISSMYKQYFSYFLLVIGNSVLLNTWCVWLFFSYRLYRSNV